MPARVLHSSMQKRDRALKVSELMGGSTGRDWGTGPRVSPRRFVLGDGFMGAEVHLPSKFSFSSLLVSRPLYLENVGKCKIFMCEEKKILKYCNFWGDVPRMIFRLRGTIPPYPRFRRPWTGPPKYFRRFIPIDGRCVEIIYFKWSSSPQSSRLTSPLSEPDIYIPHRGKWGKADHRGKVNHPP